VRQEGDPCFDSYRSPSAVSGPMWHLPQLSGIRASAAENAWRLWQAEQEPSEPSGLMGRCRVRPGRGVEPALLAHLDLATWHCQQPRTAAALTPSGYAGVLNAVFLRRPRPARCRASRGCARPSSGATLRTPSIPSRGTWRSPGRDDRRDQLSLVDESILLASSAAWHS